MRLAEFTVGSELLYTTDSSVMLEDFFVVGVDPEGVRYRTLKSDLNDKVAEGMKTEIINHVGKGGRLNKNKWVRLKKEKYTLIE